MIELKEIKKANDNIAPYIFKTPLIKSIALSNGNQDVTPQVVTTQGEAGAPGST